jgi:hypothetical protein
VFEVQNRRSSCRSSDAGRLRERIERSILADDPEHVERASPVSR